MSRNNDRLLLGLLLAFFELCFILSVIPSASTRRFANRQTFLFGCLLRTGLYIINETTTGSALGDIAVGSILAVQLLMALDGIYFTDPNSLKNLHGPNSGKKITEEPLLERIRWTFEVYTNPRGIGWGHEPSNLPARPSPTMLRRGFFLVRLLLVFGGAVLGCFACALNASNPGLTTPGRKLSESHWKWRVMTVVGLGIGATAIMNTVHVVLSVIAVAFGQSKPERWPDLFGSPFETWSLQNIWRKVWHQMLRKPFISTTHIILVDTLGLPPLSHKTNNTILEIGNKLLWIYVPFFISGLVHLGGEYMLLGKMGYGALRFFFLQALGITLEKLGAFLWRCLFPGHQPEERGKEKLKTKNHPSYQKIGTPVWVRCVGHVYVLLWITWSLPYYVDSMVNTDIFVCPRCDIRGSAWFR